MILEDGSTFCGMGFGYKSEVYGEVVFNTGMVGYTETLTDPSYNGQILCFTYPLIGNYGVPDYNIKDSFGLPQHFESNKIQISGLVIHDLSLTASHWNCIKTLDQWLYEEKIPGICGIDTRELTKKIRNHGVMNGVLSVGDDEKYTTSIDNILPKFKQINYDEINFMKSVSTQTTKIYGNGDKTVVVIDTGVKYSILRNLLRLGYKVILVPWNTTFDQIMSFHPNGVVISNGPGNPELCKSTIEVARNLIACSIPTLGICLGNQILALAAGAKTYKLKFGHRGQNKSCIDLNNNIAFVTSQNHGYGVDIHSLKETGFKTWFVNIDDNTVEGIQHTERPIMAVQFHPEASPGPYDCMFVFEKFHNAIEDVNVDKKKNIDVEMDIER